MASINPFTGLFLCPYAGMLCHAGSGTHVTQITTIQISTVAEILLTLLGSHILDFILERLLVTRVPDAAGTLMLDNKAHPDESSFFFGGSLADVFLESYASMVLGVSACGA